MMNEMLRNGSGYVDMTAYNGMTHANPGEIWTQGDRDDDYWVLLAVNSHVCTGLKLTNRDCDGSIPVTCREVMFTNPAMLGYLFHNRLGCYVKTLPKKEFEAVQKAVADALGFAAVMDKDKEALCRESVKLKEYHDYLKQKLKEVNAELEAQKKVNESLNDSVAELQLEVTCCETYKSVYYELLDKLIAAKAGAAL